MVAEQKPVADLEPSVESDEQEQLEGQGDRCRGDHHHAHGQQDIGYDQVYRDESQVEDKAYLEGFGKLGDGE